MSQDIRVSEIAISLPFTISSYGTVAATSDQNKIWQDRVLSVLGTGLDERIMFPQFGSKLYTGLFNGSTAGVDSATETIRNAIAEAFTTFLPLLSLTEVRTSFDTDEASLSVEVIYQLPNLTSVATNIGTINLNRNFPPTQES